MTGRIVYRVEIGYRDATGATGILYYTNEDLSTSPTRAARPNIYMEGRLTQPLLFRQNMFAQGCTRGVMEIGHGTIELDNSDGGLDGLTAYCFDQQIVTIYSLDSESPDTESLVWAGVAEGAFVSETSVVVTVRDHTYRFDVPFQPTKYQGSALPYGLEGTGNDFMGKPKPVLIGSVNNISPIPVNTARLIYQLHDGALFNYTLNVFDKRAPIPAGIALDTSPDAASTISLAFPDAATDLLAVPSTAGWVTGNPCFFTSYGGSPMATPFVAFTYYWLRVVSGTTVTIHPTAADAIANTNIINVTSYMQMNLVRNTTLPGIYDYYNFAGGFYIRLGSTPVGAVTCDVLMSPAYSTADAIGTVINRLPYVAPDPVAFQLLGTIPNEDVGIYVTEETTYHKVIEDLAAAANASVYGLGAHTLNLGTYAPIILARLAAPIGAPVLTITDDDVIAGSLKRIIPSDPERGAQAYRAIVQYFKVWTVQSPADIAGAAQADVALFGLEYRSVYQEDTAPLTLNPAAVELNFTTFNRNTAAANALATYLVALYGPLADMINVTIPIATWVAVTPNLGALQGFGVGPLLGSAISVATTRFPKTRALIGYVLDLDKGTVDLTLRG